MSERENCPYCRYFGGKWTCDHQSCPNFVDVSYCEYCDEPYPTDDGAPHPTREVVFCS